MSKNDDRILELKKQIETKKKSISEKKIRFIPETNCVLNMDGMTINLNVCSDDALLLGTDSVESARELLKKNGIAI